MENSIGSVVIEILKDKQKYFFPRVFSIGRVDVPSSKIVINLPLTYEKLYFKPYRSSG